MTDSNLDYLRKRMNDEQRAALASAGTPAEAVHRKFADQYALLIDEIEKSSVLADSDHSDQ